MPQLKIIGDLEKINAEIKKEKMANYTYSVVVNGKSQALKMSAKTLNYLHDNGWDQDHEIASPYISSRTMPLTFKNTLALLKNNAEIFTEIEG